MKPLAVLKLVKKELHRFAIPLDSDEFEPAYEGLKELIDKCEKAEAADAHCVIGDPLDLHGPKGALPMICVATEKCKDHDQGTGPRALLRVLRRAANRRYAEG